MDATILFGLLALISLVSTGKNPTTSDQRERNPTVKDSVDEVVQAMNSDPETWMRVLTMCKQPKLPRAIISACNFLAVFECAIGLEMTRAYEESKEETIDQWLQTMQVSENRRASKDVSSGNTHLQQIEFCLHTSQQTQQPETADHQEQQFWRASMRTHIRSATGGQYKEILAQVVRIFAKYNLVLKEFLENVSNGKRGFPLALEIGNVIQGFDTGATGSFNRQTDESGQAPTRQNRRKGKAPERSYY